MNATARTLLKAFGKGCLIGAIAGPTITITIAAYGWRTAAKSRAPWWIRNHPNRIPGTYRQTPRTGRHWTYQPTKTTGMPWTSQPQSANEAAQSRPKQSTTKTG